MALVKCTECGYDVSTKAAACPNCGAPPSSKPLGSASDSSIVRYGGGVIAILFAISVASTTGLLDSIMSSSVWGKPSGRSVHVEFAQLLSDYDNNTVAADKRYRGLAITTTANVVSVDTGYGSSMRLMLNNGPWSFKFADAYLLDSQRDAAARLKPANPVKLLCIISGGPGGRPQLKRCVIQ